MVEKRRVSTLDSQISAYAPTGGLGIGWYFPVKKIPDDWVVLEYKGYAGNFVAVGTPYITFSL